MHLRAPPGTTSGASLCVECSAADAFRNGTVVDSRTQTQDTALPSQSFSLCSFGSIASRSSLRWPASMSAYLPIASGFYAPRRMTRRARSVMRTLV